MSKVSVIIATRNRCSLLPRAVESARGASRDVQIVVVDDASEDQTPEVCDALIDVQCIRLKRRLGIGAARNVGLMACASPFISFLDDDDLRLPGSLDAQVKMLEARPDAGMIYGKALYGEDRGEAKYGEDRGEAKYGEDRGEAKAASYPAQFPQGDIFWELLRWNFVPCPTVVFRRACLTRLGLLEEEAPGVEDWDLWVRIAETHSVIATDKAVAIWRQSTPGSGQFTSHEEKLHRLAHRLYRDKWLRLPRAMKAGASRRRKVSRDFAAHASQQLVWSAASRLKAGQIFESARVTLAATRLYPLSVPRSILSFSSLRSLRSGLGTYWRAEGI